MGLADRLLGSALAYLVLCSSPERIIIGGGVMGEERLFPLIRGRMLHWLGGYIDCDAIVANADRYVVAPGLGIRAGVLGGLSLAISAAAAP